MNPVQPLASFPLVETDRIDEAEAALSQSLASCRIKSEASGFNMQLNGVGLGRVSLTYNRYGSDSTVESEFSGEPVFFVAGYGERTTFRLRDRTVGVDSSRPAMIAGAERMEIDRPENSGILVLRGALPDLERQLEVLTGHRHLGALVFDEEVDLNAGVGGSLLRLMHFLAGELERDASVVKNPMFRRGYEEMLLDALLSLPHSGHQFLFEERPHEHSPGMVSRAAEYMRANLGESITVSDLVQLCGCSRATLFSAFRNAKGYTPMEFLTEERLHAARGLLLSPEEGTSVATAALDSGFVHLGRFAGVYRKRFGERPSETLNRARRRL
jgi:AraC-like DNA-binding protein